MNEANFDGDFHVFSLNHFDDSISSACYCDETPSATPHPATNSTHPLNGRNNGFFGHRMCPVSLDEPIKLANLSHRIQFMFIVRLKAVRRETIAVTRHSHSHSIDHHHWVAVFAFAVMVLIIIEIDCRSNVLYRQTSRVPIWVHVSMKVIEDVSR